MELAPGTRIAERYVLREPIGEGGMARVWAAEHETLGREVAIKVILPVYGTNAEAIDRFMQEARILARLSHPNIVEVFDLGTLEGGAPYMVMPLLLGQTLEELRERVVRLPMTDIVSLLRGPAEAIDLLHSRGFLHRDIKPDNLFVRVADDGTEEVLLMDFGLARSLQGLRRTARGSVLGTPEYLPPEAATESGWTRAGDVYSFAVVAYELFSGALPYAPTTYPLELVQKKLIEDARPLSAHTDVPLHPLLVEIFRQALSRNPADRPPSCTDLLRALHMLANVKFTPPAGIRRSSFPPGIADLPGSTRRKA